MGTRQEKIDSLRRYTNLIQKQTGRVVRPYRFDGYVNMLNKYGTSRDVSERYEFKQEPLVPDEMLTMYYEGNGLFAKIIDAPSEEAIKHGFELDGLTDQELEDFYMEALDELDWEENMMTAVKWARLFGGSIAVMMIDDGRGLEEPLDWKNIRSIDDIVIYDRSLIQPDYNSMFSYNPDDPFGTRGSRLRMPEYYDVYSRYGTFRVHDSRCLVFQNGVLPENTSNSVYQLWGMPEYIRLKRAMRDAEVAHGTAPKLLDRSVQPVYKMKDLSEELATEEGEDRVLRRLQIIDMARGLLNSITIDSENEDYDFRTFTFTGVSEVIDATCNFLSALTNIPQTILFGRSPAGMNATGMGDLENWYNYVERLQKRMVRKNLRYLLSIIFQAGVNDGKIDSVPPIKVKFNPLWSLSEQEEAALEQTKASTQQIKAATAQVYVDMQALDPSEVRKKLADSGEFDVETMLDEYTEEELEENNPANKPQEGEGGMPGAEGMPEGMPGAEGTPEGMTPLEAPKEAPKEHPNPEDYQSKGGDDPGKQPEDTLRNAWLGNTPEEKQPEAKPEEKKEEKPEEDTLRNTWLGKGGDPGEKPEEKKEEKPEEKKESGKIIKPLPGETLRNAWLGNDPEPEKKDEEPEDTLKNAWHGVTAADPEDTLKNAWEGITPADKPAEDTLRNAWLGTGPVQEMDDASPFAVKGPGIVRTRKPEFRTSSRDDGTAGGSVGVYVVKDGKILTGVRGNGDGALLVCGPGGHIEEGETAGQAAIRETQEEFGITPMELIPFGKGVKEPGGLQPDLFLCVRYEGTPKCDEDEMHQARFTAIEEIENSGRLFPPFENGFRKLLKVIGTA